MTLVTSKVEYIEYDYENLAPIQAQTEIEIPTIQEQIEYLLTVYKPNLSLEDKQELIKSIHQASEEHGIDWLWIIAMIWEESRFEKDAISKNGAIGYMQILSSTGRKYGVSRNELFQPTHNIQCGVRYLADLRDYYGGDMEKAITAYNRGTASRGTSRYYRKIHGHYKDMESLLKEGNI